MPEDIEILWTAELVYLQPATERGADWLQGIMPAKRGRRWDMRVMNRDDLEALVVGARKNKVTVGGVKMPPLEGEEDL